MSSFDPVSKVKEWITPSLVSIVGIMLWSQLTELRTDVKQLLIAQSGNTVKIAQLEKDVEYLKTNYLSYGFTTLRKESESNRVGKKEEDPEVPSGE
jgi:hypothetical protein